MKIFEKINVYTIYFVLKGKKSLIYELKSLFNPNKVTKLGWRSKEIDSTIKIEVFQAKPDITIKI